ncbi:hypothetical protein SAMN05444392_10718 [Seinonella peptonophila]|uniref:Dolichyl-phosphate-mannose-protein mannosyltransferase n=1 Tax=Seinonella peptonophila TaxID=112248 RepID=A0A1M4YL69_9BACL|nr:hypothetical protein [Seinonella peptonophila]SHF06500.1 hypothetical protein SAMN05444392_10718 [Seinonella peptonophila]
MNGVEKRKRRWLYLWIGLIGLIIYGGTRLPFLGHLPESWDAVDFALALDRFDIHAMQPHFPGYPLFIFPAMMIHSWVTNPYLSLSIISFLANFVSLFLFYCLAKKFLSQTMSIVATVCFAVHPLVWITSLQPMSDSLGLCILLAYLYILGRHFLDTPRNEKHDGYALIGAAILYVLLLGVRLSYFPIGVVWLFALWHFLREDGHWVWTSSRWRFPLMAFILGNMTLFLWVWLVSFSEGGVLAYLKLGKAFLSGHFTDWGGTLLTEHQSLLNRLQLAFHQIWTSILNGANPGEPFISQWLALLLLLMIIWGTVELKMNRKGIFLYLSWVPMIVWVFYGQNLDKPRHLLPIVPIVILYVLIGIQSYMKYGKWTRKMGWIVIILIFLCQGLFGSYLVTRYLSPSPVMALTQYLQQHMNPDHVITFTWEEERVIHAVAPDYLTQRLRSWSVFTNRMQGLPSGTTVLLTSSVVHGFANQGYHVDRYLKLLGSWQSSERIYTPYHHLKLYQLDVQQFNKSLQNGNRHLP